MLNFLSGEAKLKILQTFSVLTLTVLLAACSSSPTPNSAALAQLGQFTVKQEANATSTVAVRNSASFEQIQAAGSKFGNAIKTATRTALDPNSPEALERAEKIGRGELPEELQETPSLQENTLHAANLENCPVQQASTGMTLSTIPMGISECEMISLRGKPSSVRKLSLPNEPRRILLSFKSSDGEMLYEFVDNKLATIY